MELNRNPFFLLGATTRDDRGRLLQLAEERSLLSDEDAVREAAAILTNPRRRLAAEVAWLPGIGPRRIADALSLLETHPAEIRGHGGLPALARANLLADGLVGAVEGMGSDGVAEWIVELAEAHEQLDAETTSLLLNEERAVAGFPSISDVEHVESELQGRRAHYWRAIKNALEVLPAATRLKIVTLGVEQATENGAVHAPVLIDDLVDSFEVEAQDFLERGAKQISAVISEVRAAVEADEDDSRLTRLLANLEGVVEGWDAVAQPIQVSARSRGLSHDLSHQVAREIRELAVDLVNDHGLLDEARRLTALQQQVFAEIDSVVEQSEEDASALDDIEQQRIRFLEDMEARAESWKKEVTYEADVGGFLFKSKLRISPEGVEWKGARIPLEEIKSLRWGGTNHYVNGIPTGTTYKIFVGSDQREFSIELKREVAYSAFVERVWRAAGARLISEMLEGLRAGEKYKFGRAVVTDFGVELERPHWFSASERVPCSWNEVTIGSGDGTFYIGKESDKKVAVQLSYQDIDNVHVLETALRVFWEKPYPRLSDLLTESD